MKKFLVIFIISVLGFGFSPAGNKECKACHGYTAGPKVEITEFVECSDTVDLNSLGMESMISPEFEILMVDMRSEEKRINAAVSMSDQQNGFNNVLSRGTNIMSRMETLKNRVSSQIGATEAVEVQTQIDAMKAQAVAWAGNL